MSKELENAVKNLLKCTQLKYKPRKWILTTRQGAPPAEALGLPSTRAEEIINRISQQITNIYIIANVNDKTFKEIYNETMEVLNTIKTVSEVNRVSNISQSEYKRNLLIIEYHWATISEYFLVKQWFQYVSSLTTFADFELRSIILDQVYTLSHISMELVDSKDFLRRISHYYGTCNHWRQLDKNLRFQIIETGKNMFVKLEARSVAIESVLMNINDEILLEKRRLRSKLQLFRIGKLFIIFLILILLLMLHFATIIMNGRYGFHFPDVGTGLLCILADTNLIASTKECWDRRRLNVNLQIFYLILLWIIIAPISYGLYIFLTSFFELHTLALLEDYSTVRQNVTVLRGEHESLNRFTMYSL